MAKLVRQVFSHRNSLKSCTTDPPVLLNEIANKSSTHQILSRDCCVSSVPDQSGTIYEGKKPTFQCSLPRGIDTTGKPLPKAKSSMFLFGMCPDYYSWVGRWMNTCSAVEVTVFAESQ